MRLARQVTILSIIILFFAVFIFLTYFFYQPDSLVNFVPENALFYLHLDLNKSRQTGYFGNQWLNDWGLGKILARLSQSDSNWSLLGNSLQKQNISLLDEVGLIGLALEKKDFQNTDKDLPKIDLVLFLKLKRWTSPSLLIKSLKQFSVQKLNKSILIVSRQPFFIKDKQLNFLKENQLIGSNFLSSISNSPVWGKGYVNLKDLIKFFKKEQEAGWLNNRFVKLSLLPPQKGPRPQSLFFTASLINQENQPLIFPFENLDFNNDLGLNFIIIVPRTGTIDFLENRIKTALSFQNPKEEEMILPDGTSFVELIVDPNVFNFEKKEIKDTQFRYWQSKLLLNREDKGAFGVILWQNEKYAFISNNFSLFKNITERTSSCFSHLQNKDFDKGMYFQIENFGIKGLMVIEISEGVKGCIDLNH